jgi:hypothetical protein
VAAAAVLVTAAACSTGPEAPADRPPTSSPSPDSVTRSSEARRVDPRRDGLQVGFGEFAIAVEAEPIRPGPVTFEVRNGGKLVHGFRLRSEEGGGSNSGPGGGGDRFEIRGPRFGPEETVRIETFLEPGLYELECFVADHDDRGMEILLRVEPNAPLVKVELQEPGTVNIKGFAFVPATVEVPRGTRVRWRNRDPTQHTVTARDGSFSSDPLSGGATFAFVFAQPGTYTYRCAIHPTMEGTVTVR